MAKDYSRRYSENRYGDKHNINILLNIVPECIRKIMAEIHDLARETTAMKSVSL